MSETLPSGLGDCASVPGDAGWTISGEVRFASDTKPPRARLASAGQAPLASRFELAPDDGESAATTVGFSMESGGLHNEAHSHQEAQLLYVARGEFMCEADNAWWIVPPGSALWIPGDMPHRVRGSAPLEGYNVFVAPSAARAMPSECRSVAVTPLLREVVVKLAARSAARGADGPGGRLVGVLLDELADVPVEEHRLPMPSDRRLRRLVELVTASPADGATAAEWGRRVGLAERTLTRTFARETGMSFGRWRRQLHVVMAIQRLSRGVSVQRVAEELGYDNASSFVTMFRKVLGEPPARYLANRQRQTSTNP